MTLPMQPGPMSPMEMGRDRVATAFGGGKQSKQEVNYRRGSPKERCALCSHFNQQGSCELVAGRINADDVCDLFDPKAPPQESQQSRSGEAPPEATEVPPQ